MSNTRKIKTLNPSDFCAFPFDSVLQKTEAEIIAKNIMLILQRTGNKFRALTWEEYREERLKDGKFSVSEKIYFDQVIEFCKSADTASLFSKVWKIN